MHSFEVEIKSLLGAPEKADELRDKLRKADPSTELLSKNKQLNHYFVEGDVEDLCRRLKTCLSKADAKKLQRVIALGSDFSVRTRLIEDTPPLFVIKASRDEGTSHNTVSRLEFETEVLHMTLQELDELILSSGFAYQAKWSREREEYRCRDISVCLDKNAGYGYLAEFEKVVDDESRTQAVQEELRALMTALEVEELPQDRLERMFAHYNKHWPEYYGTEKIFVVE